MITLTRETGLWIATIDRPDKANALTEAMLETLCGIAEDARTARVLILTGRGSVFSAGADLDAARAGLATSPLWERLSGALCRLDALTIAALNGTCAGGAMGMALACDLRVAMRRASFFYPVMSLGFLPQPSDPPRLARLVGPARAKMILMAGARVGAEEAAAWGLVDRICDGDALQEACDLSRPVLSASPDHAKAIKRLIG